VAVLLGLAAPEAVLVVLPGELAARLDDGARGAQLERLRFPPGPRLRTLGFGCEEERRSSEAVRLVSPVARIDDRNDAVILALNRQSNSAARLATSLRSHAVNVTWPKQR
jgi:hypothetical protein